MYYYEKNYIEILFGTQHSAIVGFVVGFNFEYVNSVRQVVHQNSCKVIAIDGTVFVAVNFFPEYIKYCKFETFET